jgi:hypothetical protein
MMNVGRDKNSLDSEYKKEDVPISGFHILGKDIALVLFCLLLPNGQIV